MLTRVEIDRIKGEVKNNPSILKYKREEAKKNLDIVMEAVKANGEALEFASEELRNNSEIVMEAVKADGGYVLKYAGPDARNNPEVVKELHEESNSERRTKYKKGDVIHTPSKIADGIEPTQTGINEVVDEMLATQNEKNEQNKDEKPGEEPGDN